MRIKRVSESIGMIPRQEDYPSKEELLKKYGYEGSTDLSDYYDAKKQFEDDWLRRFKRQESEKRQQTEKEISDKAAAESLRADEEKRRLEEENIRRKELDSLEREIEDLHNKANKKAASKIVHILSQSFANNDERVLSDLIELINKYPQYHKGSLFESVKKFRNF